MEKTENVTREAISSPAPNATQSMTEMKPTPYAQAAVKPKMAYQMIYPEVFYRLQPYIMMVCDQMEYGSVMPTMETVQHMTDNIYDDVCRMYPDLAEYVRNNENKAKDDPPPFDRDPDMFGRRFRRRGVFKDLIDILILSELFGRRRRFF